MHLGFIVTDTGIIVSVIYGGLTGKQAAKKAKNDAKGKKKDIGDLF